MILILEDDIDILEIHADLLSRHFRSTPILRAPSVREGLRLVAEHGLQIQLLMADYELGDGNGAQVALALKELRFATPCILVTSALHWIPPRDFELFDRILPKPVDRGDFINALRHIPGFAA